jgi:hypothetical protein
MPSTGDKALIRCQYNNDAVQASLALFLVALLHLPLSSFKKMKTVLGTSIVSCLLALTGAVWRTSYNG